MTAKAILMISKAFIFLFLSQSHAAACVECVFFPHVCWYEETGPYHNTLLVFSARGAWLSSCHTVARGTCPVIWTDPLDMSEMT